MIISYQKLIQNTTMNLMAFFNHNKILPLKFSSSSLKNTNDLISISKENGYGFIINHCSMEKKELQMTQRRLKFGKIFNDSEYDLIMPDGTINNYYRITHEFITNYLDSNLMNEKTLENLIPYRIKINKLDISHSTDFVILLASYIPKMEIGHKKVLIKLELI
jgi:hypothetical protein